MQLTKEIIKVIDNFLHEKGIYGVDCDDLEHKIAETINGKEFIIPIICGKGTVEAYLRIFRKCHGKKACMP